MSKTIRISVPKATARNFVAKEMIESGMKASTMKDRRSKRQNNERNSWKNDWRDE